VRKAALLLALVAVVTAHSQAPSAAQATPLRALPGLTPAAIATAEGTTVERAVADAASIPGRAAAPAPVARGALPAAPAADGTQQLRAYWVDAFGEGLRNPEEIERLVADTKAANMNAIVAQVVRRGDCFCNRSSLPRTEAPIAALPFDPLETLIEKAHAQGIEVHAWIIATGIWRGRTAPKDPAHAFNTHGPNASGSENWLMRRSDGADRLITEGEEFFLDPGHPDAAAYVVRMATSIAESYAVDGINIDRIRYPDGNIGGAPSWGYNPTAVARFQAATGRTDVPSTRDAQWTQWRRDRVTDIVRRIYVDTYALRSQIRVSVDTITYGYGPQSVGGWTGTRTYAELLQDWVAWMREGIVDLNIPMDYKRDASADQRRMYAEWAEYAKEQQYGRHAAIGSALYLNDIAGSVRQVRTALAPGGSGRSAVGWVGYSWRNPDPLTESGARSGAIGRAELATALTQPSSYDTRSPPVFATSAAVPAMPWKAAPTTGLLRGTATGRDGAAIAYAAVELRDANGALVRNVTTDATGWFAFVDLAPGTYRATVGGTAFEGTVVAGQVATARAAGSAPCASTNSVGPGIPPPATVPTGLPGFHASWYGQSGYPTLCPGERSTAVVAFYNSGSRGWVAGRMGEVAYLGTWKPEPGQDRPSVLGGDGALGSPNTAWPRFNRVALQPHEYVGPGQVAWFQFTIQAPSTPGTYRLAIRPLIEGAQWMEDFGVFWYVTVR
jgi:uncharacterized lipoprotein YddW (UPF0748 family)